jgi:hypothetical protein
MCEMRDQRSDGSHRRARFFHQLILAACMCIVAPNIVMILLANHCIVVLETIVLIIVLVVVAAAIAVIIAGLVIDTEGGNKAIRLKNEFVTKHADLTITICSTDTEDPFNITYCSFNHELHLNTVQKADREWGTVTNNCADDINADPRGFGMIITRHPKAANW